METNLILSSSPHIHTRDSSRRIMLDVIIALLPAAIAGVIIFGAKALGVIAACVITAVVSEALFNLVVHKQQTVGDLSAVVTGLLLALNLSTNVAIWQCVVGTAFAIVVVKCLFGGLGKNFANPAITGRVFMLLAFSTVAGGAKPAVVELVSSATPLELLAAFTALPEADTEWCAILPRVWRDRDEAELRRWLDHAKALGVTAVLAGNIGHLSLVRDTGLAVYGDYGLNVFNGRALDYLRKKGLSSACLSFELRFAQLRDLPKCLPAEAIVYGRLPLMITENCLIENAGACRCDRPNFLTDRTGAAFPLLPAYGHRTEIQNSRVLWLADRPEYRRLGLAYARLRFTTETPEECVRVFRDYLAGAAASGEFTRGLYERGVE